MSDEPDTGPIDDPEVELFAEAAEDIDLDALTKDDVREIVDRAIAMHEAEKPHITVADIRTVVTSHLQMHEIDHPHLTWDDLTTTVNTRIRRLRDHLRI